MDLCIADFAIKSILLFSDLLFASLTVNIYGFKYVSIVAIIINHLFVLLNFKAIFLFDGNVFQLLRTLTRILSQVRSFLKGSILIGGLLAIAIGLLGGADQLIELPISLIRNSILIDELSVPVSLSLLNFASVPFRFIYKPDFAIFSI